MARNERMRPRASTAFPTSHVVTAEGARKLVFWETCQNALWRICMNRGACRPHTRPHVAAARAGQVCRTRSRYGPEPVRGRSMPDRINRSLVVAALSLVVSVLAYWRANEEARSQRGLIPLGPRGRTPLGKSYGRIVAAPLLASIRDQSCCGLEPTCVRLFFKKGPPLSPKGIVGFEGASCDVTKLKAHRDHKYVKRNPP